jgi:PAS domain S-box-containing protein
VQKGIGVAIIKNKKAALTLTGAESPYRVLIESINEGAANVSSEGLVLYCNERLASLLGRPLKKIIGRPLRSFVSSEDRQAYDALVKRGQRRSASAELILRPGRGHLPVNCSCRPIKLEGIHSLAIVIADITERKKAEQALRRANEDLGRRIKERTAELEESRAECEMQNEKLLSAQAFLRSYGRHLIEREEDIKKKLAADLHDELGQNLTYLSINFAMLKEALPEEVRKKHRARLKDVNDLVEGVGRVARNIMSELRPPVLDEFGLPASLRWHCGLFSKRTGIAVNLRAVDPSLRLPPEKEVVLFRIVQEALVNIAKHAAASRVTLELRSVDGLARLLIADNGRGFDPGADTSANGDRGWGLTIMRERAIAIGGSFRLDAEPGKGTKIIIEIPGGH